MSNDSSTARAVLVALACISLLACGGNRGPGDGPPVDGDGGMPGTDGRVPGDGAVPPPPPPPPMTASCGGDLSVGHRMHTLGRIEALQSSSGRIVSFPEYLSSSLSAMPVLELTEEGGRVVSVAVTGDVPDGRVYGGTYQPTLDRFIVLTWSRNPEPHYGLSSMELQADQAVFTDLTLVNGPVSDGFLFGSLVSISGNRVAGLRGIDVLQHVTIEGSTATFSAEMEVSTVNYPETIVSDPANGRLIGYGLGYDPMMPFENAFLPKVFTLSLEAGGGWVEVPAFGDAPLPIRGDDALSIYQPWAAYDSSSDRLTVVHSRVEEDPFFPGERYLEPLLYTLDLSTTTWELVSEDPEADVYATGTPWLVDPQGHRSLSIIHDSLVSFHLEGPEVGQQTTQPLEGAVGPRSMVSATALPDGRIAATDRGGRVRVLDTGAVPAWSFLGDVQLPHDVRAQHSLVYDPVDGSLLVFGGANTHSDPGSNRLHRIDIEGSSIEELTIPGAPSPRSYPSALVHSGKLYVAGGQSGSSTERSALDDVWELDLSSMAWRQLGTVSVGRTNMQLIVSGGELWFIGGVIFGSPDFMGTPRVDAMDLVSGATREVVVSGAWPARQGIFYGGAALGNGFVGFDIVDDTIDGNMAVLWHLEPDGAGGASWNDLGGCFTDAIVANTRGVAVGPDQVWAIGEHVLSITR